MRKWFFEVRHGMLRALPSSLANVVDEQKSKGATCLFISEAGTLLNEPDRRSVAPVFAGTQPISAIACAAEAIGWVFDRLESELDQDFQYNYLKVSFVNVNTIHDEDATGSGMMSTNHPDLPETFDGTHQIVHQMTTAIRTFMSHLRAATEIGGWESDVFACDWVSMTFNKSQ